MIKLDFLSNDYKERKTPAQIVEEAIAVDIITGKIPSGKRLNETTLCERFAMSRTPIREILRRIEGSGLARSVPNRGVFAVGLTSTDIDDYFYLKSILEVQCTRWAIERIDKELMELLEETFDFMQFYTMSNDLPKILRINDGFDAIIYNASQNKEIEKRLADTVSSSNMLLRMLPIRSTTFRLSLRNTGPYLKLSKPRTRTQGPKLPKYTCTRPCSAANSRGSSGHRSARTAGEARTLIRMA